MVPDHPNIGPSLTWVSEGQKVWAPLANRSLLLCEVVCAAGHHARLRNERHGFDRWYDIHDCFEFKETVH